MPNIYKASFVTIADSAVPIDTGEAPEEPKPNTPVTMNTTISGNDYQKPHERVKSKEDVLEDARDEAELIILKARNEAQLITDNAEKEINRLRTETEENARSKGYEEGYGKGESEAEALKHEGEEMLRDARAKRDEMLSDMEPQIVSLIIRILKKLLGDYIQLNPQIILNLIREGLSGTVGSEGVKLRVSPDDYDFAMGHFDKIAEYAGAKSVEVIKDAALKPMDCVIETAYGIIDSSLDQQFESLKADLLYTLNSAEA